MVSKFVDAYGHLIMDFFKGKAPIEIIERDDGLLMPGRIGTDRYFSAYRDWSPLEKRAMKYVRGRVLDVGCGAGRHSLYLQGKGFDVTGLDNSPLAVRVCRERGLKKTVVLPATAIGKLPEGRFDTILMMGHNFGLLGGLSQARRMLKAMDRITTDQGRVIAETFDPHDTKDPVHLRYHRRNLKRGRMAGLVRLRVRHKQFIGAWIDYLFASKEEVRSALKGTVWRVEKFLHPKGMSYVAVIQKIGKKAGGL